MNHLTVFCAVTVTATILAPTTKTEAATDGRLNLVFCCAADIDLYRVMSAAAEYPRHDSAAKAVRAAADGAGVLILADGYPQQTTPIAPTLFDLAAKKKLRLFVEYPTALPDIEVGQPVAAHVERAVVTSDFFGDDLKKLRIVSINGLHYLPVQAHRSHIVAARVAGFDRAALRAPAQTDDSR